MESGRLPSSIEGHQKLVVQRREERPQTKLHQQFYPLFEQISAAFFGSHYDLSQKPCWAILMGIEDYFLLHLAPDFETAAVYNSCDENHRGYPMLVHGFSERCSPQVMAKIVEKFPPKHKGLPSQAAFAIRPNPLGNLGKPVSEAEFVNLIDGAPLQMGDFMFEVMVPPSGKESLSFRKAGFPLEFWTHLSRDEVLKTALAKAQAAHIPGQKTDELDALALADLLQKDIDGYAEAAKKSEIELRKLEGNLRVLNKLQAQIPDVESKIQRKESEIEKKKETVAAQQVKLDLSRDGFEAFKETPLGKKLPRSYLRSTFQLAVDFFTPEGVHVYKRFSDTGHVHTEIDGSDEIRYQNAVHLPYSDMNV